MIEEFNSEDFNNRFSGIARLYGIDGIKRLLNSHVLIIGLGGVGTWTAEALARSGVGRLTLVDLDDVCITNTNRQIHTLNHTIGKNKAAIMKERILAINPQCEVKAYEEFFTDQNADALLDYKYDYVIDAFDSLQNKCLLAAKCRELKIPLIISGGAAGKRNPTLIKIDDLGLAINDTLLKAMRKRLRQEFNFPSAAGYTRSKKQTFKIACVYSPENPVFPTQDGHVCSVNQGEGELNLNCRDGMGSATHITGIFGFMAASFVIDQIAGANQFSSSPNR